MKKFVIAFLFLTIAQSIFAVEFYTQKDVDDAKNRAFSLYKTEKKDEALKILGEIPKKYKTEDMYIVISNIYEDRGDSANAFKYLNTALQINPESYKIYYNMGLLSLKMGNFPLAIKNFKKSAKYNPEFAYSYYNMGCAKYKMGDLKGAKRDFVRAITIKNNEKDFYYNLALTYKELKKDKEAKKILDTYNSMN